MKLTQNALGEVLGVTSLPQGGEIIIILMVLGILGILGLWLWSLIHCICNKALTDTNRIIGVVLILILGLLGSLIYMFLPREKQPN